MGKKGWWDGRSFPRAVLTHSTWQWGFPWLAGWCGIPAFAGYRVVGLPGSTAAAAGWGLVRQHLPASLAVGSWEGSLPPAWDAGTCVQAVFHTLLLSRSWCFHQHFLSPHWSLQCLDMLSYIFFMAFHLQGRAMPCSFWLTCALDIQVCE